MIFGQLDSVNLNLVLSTIVRSEHMIHRRGDRILRFCILFHRMKQYGK